MQFLRADSVHNTASGFDVRTEALQCLEAVFSVQQSPFAHDPECINYYIQHHICCLLTSMREDPFRRSAVKDCCSHLRILLAFSENKNAAIVDKFRKLDFFTFLMKQVNLEHEVNEARL